MSCELHLREWREACGLTQADVCEVIRRSAGHLSKLETGKAPLKVSLLAPFARLYKCHPFDLLTFAANFPLPRVLREWRCAVCGSPYHPPEEPNHGINGPPEPHA